MATNRDPDPFELTLQLHNYDVPCLMELSDPSCPNQASWLMRLRHVPGVGVDCGPQAPVPLCTAHINSIKASFSSFWAMWFGGVGISRDCPACGKPFEIESIDPIQPRGNQSGQE